MFEPEGPNIQGTYDVRMLLKGTGTASKLKLGHTIGLFAVAALRTSTAGVARIDCYTDNPGTGRLILNEHP